MRTNERKPVQVTVSEWETTYACDGCGKKIDPDDWAGDYAHELLNADPAKERDREYE